MFPVISVVLLSAALTVVINPSHSWAGTASGSSGSAGSHGSMRQEGTAVKPRSLQPVDAPPGRAERERQPPLGRESLEERLRRGLMDQPTAQGQVSDRLEQFHRGTSGDSAAAQPDR